MIFGEYPCCDGELTLTIPAGARLPRYFREECPHCGTPVWHKLSRFEPMSWTEADFLEEFDVDTETKQITPKQGQGT